MTAQLSLTGLFCLAIFWMTFAVTHQRRSVGNANDPSSSPSSCQKVQSLVAKKKEPVVVVVPPVVSFILNIVVVVVVNQEAKRRKKISIGKWS